MNKTKEYDYGRENDIERLRKATAGIHSAKLNKMPKGHLDSMDNAELCDIDHPVNDYGTLLQRDRCS